MNKIFIYLILFILITNCSIDNKSGIWSSSKKKINNKEEKLLSKVTQTLNKEYNSNIKVKINDNYSKNNFNNHSNNFAVLNYNGNLKEIGRYKFSKIENFQIYRPDLTFTINGNLIYFDGKGAIFKLNKNFDIIWKKNFYTKKEKKLSPILNLSVSKNNIIISDNLSNIYNVNSITGKLEWKKKNDAAFNSQIKILDNKIYLVDLNNTLKCISLIDGSNLWQYKSENTLIKSTKKISLIIFKNKVIFLNSVGDINALDTENGNLLWQAPLINSSIYDNSFSTVFSELVLNGKSIYVSNNKNEFFSINSNTGVVRWRKKINSSQTPIITKDLIFTITEEGYLVVLNKKNGDLIRSTKIKTKKNKLINFGFLVTKNNIYLSSNSNLIIIDIMSGKFKKSVKISRNLISKPYIYKKSLYFITDKNIKKYN